MRHALLIIETGGWGALPLRVPNPPQVQSCPNLIRPHDSDMCNFMLEFIAPPNWALGNPSSCSKSQSVTTANLLIDIVSFLELFNVRLLSKHVSNPLPSILVLLLVLVLLTRFKIT